MSENQNKIERLHNFELSSFKQAQQTMIATSDNAYSGSRYGSQQWLEKVKDYSPEEIKKIIESGSLSEQ